MPSRPDESSLAAEPVAPNFWTWVGRAALGLVIAVAISRTTMLEFLRDPFAVTPGTPAAARATGPVTSLLLDLLAAVPALLVLARAAFDRSFSLRRSWGNAVMALLAGWVAFSVAWADDRFAAAIDAATICSALALLWATQQLVRSWRHVRVIAAVAFGVLLIYASHGLIDRFVELPARQENFTRNLPDMLKNLHIDPGSFEANRLAQKINGGELLGFGASINTFAAVMVMAAIIAAGAIIQRLKDRQAPAAAVALIVLLAGAAVVLRWTDSRTAFATPFIAAMLFVTVAIFGRWLNAHRALALLAVLAVIAGGTAFLVHHGLKTGKLFQDSLNFRWRYWVGAWGVWLEHPLRGVGLDGFGLHYVTHRLPIASEEVKDPHNYIVRAFAELGLIGGALTLLWTVRAAWEMTRPAAVSVRAARPVEAPVDPPKLSDFGKIAILFTAATLLTLVASIDFAWLDANAFIETLKRLLYLCVGVIGAALVSLQSMDRQQIDDRPAPWIRASLTIAVLIFLVHNLIDFAMFEYSAMFFAAMVSGAAWGVGMEERPPRRGLATVQLVIAVLIWLAVAVALVVPTITAESAAASGDDSIRKSEFLPAAKAYADAFAHWPGNADYAFRAATAMAQAAEQEMQHANGVWATPPQVSRDDVEGLLDSAIAANPMNPKYYRVRAEFEGVAPGSKGLIVCSNYERALQIDPASVDMRLEYARALALLGNTLDAVAQYERALAYNDQLDPADPKRLSAAKVTEIRKEIERLGGKTQ